MARLQPTAQLFRIAAQKTLEATKQALVETAKREHRKVMDADPKPQFFSRFVDGAKGAPEEAVKANGVIVYQYQRLDLVAAYAMETLFDLSPALSGEYRNSHVMFLNGVQVANLKEWKSGDEVSITNPVPYSRKIELGKMKMRVPGSDEVYQQARTKVMSRFGNVATIKFTYRALVGGRGVNQQLAASSGQPWWLGGAGSRAAIGSFEKTLGTTQHNRSEIRFPVLIITER